jgi:hypothetical protein
MFRLDTIQTAVGDIGYRPMMRHDEPASFGGHLFYRVRSTIQL